MRREDFKTGPRDAAELGRHNFDPAIMRSALVYWRERERRWIVEKAMSGARSYEVLSDLGELLFGKPPWSCVQVVDVFGPLSALERAVLELPPPVVEVGGVVRREPLSSPEVT